MGNLLVGQSGGPTAVINGSLYGVVREAYEHSERINHVYGMVNGLEGYLKGNVLDFESIESEQREFLKTTPGAFLGSCRYRLPEDLEDPVFEELFAKFEQQNIEFILYIGGNDSMDTVAKLSSYARRIGSDIKILGIPKTIDNDLILTDHTPGFGSAARFVASTVREIAVDAAVYDTKSVTIVEVMGRHAGWLTAASVLARTEKNPNPVLIYLPESDFNQEVFLDQVKEGLKRNQNLVVCVSEGIHDKQGTFICEYDAESGTDTFGHKMLAGCGKYLEHLVKERLQVKVRSVELNVPQRCSAIQISATDLLEAVEAGRFGVEQALQGTSGQMICFQRENGTYGITCKLQPVSEICNQEKKIPSEWITRNGSDLTQVFIEYCKPLIQGKVELPVGADGLPFFLIR